MDFVVYRWVKTQQQFPLANLLSADSMIRSHQPIRAARAGFLPMHFLLRAMGPMQEIVAMQWYYIKMALCIYRELLRQETWAQNWIMSRQEPLRSDRVQIRVDYAR